MTTKEGMLSAFLNFDFEGERKRRLEDRRQKRAELAQTFEYGHPLLGTWCMECPEPRWWHPKAGETVLCRYHLYGYIFWDENAPPLRRGFDYVSVPRKTFLIEQPPGSELPIIDKDP